MYVNKTPFHKNPNISNIGFSTIWQNLQRFAILSSRAFRGSELMGSDPREPRPTGPGPGPGRSPLRPGPPARAQPIIIIIINIINIIIIIIIIIIVILLKKNWLPCC
jgi:hypothetical protein